MKKSAKKIAVVNLVVTLFITSIGCNEQIKSSSVESGDLTTEVTNEITETSLVTQSVESELVPSVKPDMTTPALSPVLSPEPTMTPMVELDLTPILMPTPIPTPTCTPTPKVVMPEGEPYASMRVGDDAWFDFYEDKTLVLRGTGVTYDLSDAYATIEEDGQNKYYLSRNKEAEIILHDTEVECPFFLAAFTEDINWPGKRIIIEEGITELSTGTFAGYYLAEEIYFPSSLRSIGEEAFSYVGYQSESVLLVGLDISKVNIASDAFYGCEWAASIDELEKYAPIPTPIPTVPAPTPRPDVTPIPGTYYSYQMGDNIAYHVYENGTLHVVGEGSTYDFDSYYEAYYTLKSFGGYRLKTKKVIVEEGITRIGDFGLAFLTNAEQVYLPSTLEELGEYAFYGSGEYDGCVWKGLTPEKWTMQTNSLLGCRHIQDDPRYAQYCELYSTPVDPDNPQIRHTMQLGDNAFLDFMDNGYLYVRGTGALWDKKTTFHIDDTYQNEQAVLREVSLKINHIVVEEGITYLGNSLKGMGLGTVDEIFLPSTLEGISKDLWICADKMHFYYEGKRYILTEKVESYNDVGVIFNNLHYVMTDATEKEKELELLKERLIELGTLWALEGHRDYALIFNYNVVPE